MLEDRLYTLAEVAKMTKLTDRTLRNYLANKTLIGRKIGGQWRFTKDDIRALFSNDKYFIDRKHISENNIEKFIDKKMKFQSKESICLIIDIESIPCDERIKVHKKIQEIEKDNDVLESVFFVDDDDNVRINIISSLDYASKIIQCLKEK